ncbi:hypothetical protein P8452_39589 [Trifolium repens]|nr:hypothetical protein P8452_39589 [Trifolium repens]
MDCISESCSVINECRILQTCNSAYSDGYYEPPNKKLKSLSVVDPPSSTSTQQMKPDKFMIEYREYVEKKRQERYAASASASASAFSSASG